MMNELEQISVSRFPDLIPFLVEYLQTACKNFKTGRVANYYLSWRRLTKDSDILSTIRGGAEIEYNSLPEQFYFNRRNFINSELEIINSEIQTLIKKRVVEITTPERGQIISPIFLVPKPDGSFCLILNLKEFNNHVVYHHSKMDTLNTITQLMSPNCFMASLDLKDAYYSIPVANHHRKYLCFNFNNVLYRYTCLPNGLSSCPRLFTKLLKPALASLHKKGHIVTAYLDDIYIQGNTLETCTRGVIESILLFTDLGFIIHLTKSAFQPSQEIKMLGFILNSQIMRVYPTQEKREALTNLCKRVLENDSNTIRQIAQLLGRMVSLFSGVQYGPLHFRRLERAKTLALKNNRGNYDKKMSIDSQECDEIRWWINNIHNSFKPLLETEPDIVITTDASLISWGAVFSEFHDWRPLDLT